jgi:hypothetical protein
MHSEKPLERQVRYSLPKYTDKPSQRLQERREAAETADPLFLAETYRQAILAKSSPFPCRF